MRSGAPARGRATRFLLWWGLLALPACGREPGGPELRFWAFGREGEVVAELVRGFEREHPGVRVRVQQIPWSAAHEKVLTAIVGRATPDLAQMGNTWIPEMAALGALAPVQGPVADSAYFPGILATNIIDDTLFGLPWYVDTRVIFYRKDLLARAGFDSMPTTWDGWRQAMLALKRDAGPGQYAIFLPTNEWPPQVILGLQQGSPLIDERGFGTFQGPEFTRAFDFLMSMYRDGLAAPVSNNTIANLYQEFARGTFAMYISGPWNLGEFRRRLPPELQDDWGTAPLPGPDGPGVSLAGGASLVVFRASKHADIAHELVEYLTRPEQQIQFYRLTGDLPARLEAWNDPVLAADSEAVAFRTQLTRVVPTPMVPEWEQATTKIMDFTESAARGRQTPAAALASLDAAVDRLLERRRYLLERRRLAAAP